VQHAAAPSSHRGAMAGVMDFDFSGGFSLPADQRGVLAGQSAFTEDSVGLDDYLTEREAEADQAPEQGVELRHQHGSCHALAGDISEHEEKLSIVGDQVAIVTTYRAERCVMVTSLPTIDPEVRLGQEVALHLCRQFKIALQRGALRLGQVVEAMSIDFTIRSVNTYFP
jgi:hypothetical protein